MKAVDLRCFPHVVQISIEMCKFQLFSETGTCTGSYKAQLKSRYSYLADNLELTELIPWLQSYEVLSSHDSQSINACVTEYKNNCCLLDHLEMKSDQQIQTFIQGLRECNQVHLAQKIDFSGTCIKH